MFGADIADRSIAKISAACQVSEAKGALFPFKHRAGEPSYKRAASLARKVIQYIQAMTVYADSKW